MENTAIQLTGNVKVKCALKEMRRLLKTYFDSTVKLILKITSKLVNIIYMPQFQHV